MKACKCPCFDFSRKGAEAERCSLQQKQITSQYSEYFSVGQAHCGPGGAVRWTHLEKGTSVEELPPSKWLEGMCGGHFLDHY